MGMLVHFALESKAVKCADHRLCIELLKLTTVLIERASSQLLEHRKDLIKFAWGHLKSDDARTRMWAYVNVSNFIAVYETPPKIILQVSAPYMMEIRMSLIRSTWLYCAHSNQSHED